MRFNAKIFFLLLVVVTAAAFVYPNCQFQDLLSQGDHGRDLYAFEQVTKGKLPYKDFWWVYGPLMPYYYGLCIKMFGAHITSVLFGRALLEVACAVFFYGAAAALMPPGLAYLGAVWFLQTRQEFFFTYNHIGGIAASLAIAYGLFAYIRLGRVRYLWMTLPAALLFTLIKINFGLAALIGLTACAFLIDRVKQYPSSGEKKKFYLAAGICIPLVAGLIYGALLKDLPLYAIRQCMPYFGDDQPHHVPPLLAITYYVQQHWLTLAHHWTYALNASRQLPFSPAAILICVFSWLYMLESLAMHACAITVVALLASGKIQKEERAPLLLGLAAAGLFFALYFHEFLVSGVWYRTYWSFPFLALFHFLMIATALNHAPKIFGIMVKGLFGVLLAFGLVTHYQSIESQKQPARYLALDRGRIYLGNEAQWTDTVGTVTTYLTRTLKGDELFFALPYDCLYYYLTGKESPTRQLIFFNHIKIPPAQEVSVIRDLERKKVAYVLLSNRMASSETGLGIFGKTYCPLIAQYIQDHFTPIARQGGDWGNEPGWANNHGVIIFKKK